MAAILFRGENYDHAASLTKNGSWPQYFYANVSEKNITEASLLKQRTSESEDILKLGP